MAVLAPKVAAASLLMVAVNYEGLTPTAKRGRPRNVLATLSDDFTCERKEIMAGMCSLCSAYSGD